MTRRLMMKRRTKPKTKMPRKRILWDPISKAILISTTIAMHLAKLPITKKTFLICMTTPKRMAMVTTMTPEAKPHVTRMVLKPTLITGKTFLSW